MGLYFNKESDRDLWYQALTGHHNDPLSAYQLKETLGVGRFSTVRRAEYVSNEISKTCAIKIISKKTYNDNERLHLFNEISILKIVNHPSVPNLIDIIEDPDKVYIITTQIEGGELFSHIKFKKSIALSQSILVCKKLLKLLEYLSQFKLIHRDIKPENILIKCNKSQSKISKIFLIDFGIADYYGAC